MNIPNIDEFFFHAVYRIEAEEWNRLLNISHPNYTGYIFTQLIYLTLRIRFDEIGDVDNILRQSRDLRHTIETNLMN